MTITEQPAVEGECIRWHMYIDPLGYGRKRSGNRMLGAHRWAYEQIHGPVPEGLTVDHLCFNRSCVNVEHMRLLTFNENRGNTREAKKKACVNSHDYTPENTYRCPATGTRSCRACNRAAAARYAAKKKATR